MINDQNACIVTAQTNNKISKFSVYNHIRNHGITNFCTEETDTNCSSNLSVCITAEQPYITKHYGNNMHILDVIEELSTSTCQLNLNYTRTVRCCRIYLHTDYTHL